VSASDTVIQVKANAAATEIARLEMVQRGFTVADIAHAENTTEDAIRAWMKRRREKERWQRRKDDMHTHNDTNDLRRKLWEQGLTDKEIAEASESTSSAIRTWRGRVKLSANRPTTRTVGSPSKRRAPVCECGTTLRPGDVVHLVPGQKFNHWVCSTCAGAA
jgi:predicted transcriptional regulator